MILLSGSVRFYMEFGYILIPLFLLLSIILFLWFGKNRKMPNVLLLTFLILFPLFNISFLNTSLASNLAYSCILFTLASYFTIISIKFNKFRQVWLSLINFLCLISIVVQIFHDLGNLIPSDLDIRGRLTTLYFFNCDWGEHRLSSIYWEPGQFQVLLIVTLCLFTDELCKLKEYKLLLRKFGLIILALVMTLSTTGYLCLMILMFSIFNFSSHLKISLDKRLLYSFLSILTLSALWASEPVQMKLDQSKELDENSSASIRLADNIALLRTISDAPLLGLGLDTVQQNHAKIRYGNKSSSNGWLNAASAYGVIYVGCILITIFIRIKSMPRGISAPVIWLTLVVTQSNEYLIFFPYMYLFIFNFKEGLIGKYQKQNSLYSK